MPRVDACSSGARLDLAAAVEQLGVSADGAVPLDLEYEHVGRLSALVLPLGVEG